MEEGVLDFKNIVPIFGRIEEGSAKPVLQRICELAMAEPPSIDLLICSPGGCVNWGTAIIETVRTIAEYKQIPVFAIGLSNVVSMAATIWLSVPKDRRILTKKTFLYFHPTRTTAKLSFDQRTTATIDELEEVMGIIKQTKRFDAELIDQLAAETKLPMEQVTDRVSKGWMVTASEAMELHLASKVI